MALLIIKRTVLIVVAAGLCYLLAEQFGAEIALLIWGVAAAVGCGVGTAALRASKVGQITWKNRLAGYLIPWGWRLNRGALWPIPVISWVVWMAVGGTVVLLRPEAVVEAPVTGIRIALFASWAIDAAAAVYVLGTIRQATPGGRVGTLWKLVVFFALLIGVSVGLYLGGLTNAALIVAGGPPVVAGVCAGLVILLFATVGRNTRWN